MIKFYYGREQKYKNKLIKINFNILCDTDAD